jgi:hypothetical protein
LTLNQEMVDFSDRTHLERQFYAEGEQTGYRQFIPADHLLVVGHGVEDWRAFAESASDEERAQAVVRVKHYTENVLVVDAQAKV